MKRVFRIAALLLLFSCAGSFAAESSAAQPADPVKSEASPTVTAPAVQVVPPSDSSAWKYMAAALAVGLSCIAGGVAVGRIGAAAMGAMSENPELSGKALPYAGLAEGICLWGFLVALFILLI